MPGPAASSSPTPCRKRRASEQSDTARKSQFQEFSGRHTHPVGDFAAKVGKERSIDVIHSADSAGHHCTVTICYWDESYLQD
ncbi:MAG TPA: hypothetical protein EYG11_18755 [Candidatus Latescibacteria bacterium]|nr:hypothetical protein [Candidatus Latescibacterota bacterium]